MKNPVNILWISLGAPTQRSDQAGGNSFNYYFKSFYNDQRFKVKIIAQINRNLPLMDINPDDCFYLKREGGFKNKIKRLSSIESKYNPFNRNANLISNQMEHFVKQKIKYLKEIGFLPDAVILEWTQCVILAGVVKKLLPKAKIIAIEHDVTFLSYERKYEYNKGLKHLYWHYKYKHEKNVELNALKLCDLIMLYNPDNSILLTSEGIPSDKIRRFTPYFHNMNYISRNPNTRDILFYGAMDRPENYLSAIWFIENVLPNLNDLNVRFVVLGSNPDEKLNSYKSKNVIITGFVNSIDPYFEQSVCMVAPLVLGAGIKVKIIESLSAGIPVLTNEIGIEGIPAINGKDYIFCESAEDYETAIRAILNGDIDIDLLSENARDFISQNFSPENFGVNYRSMILDLCNDIK